MSKAKEVLDMTSEQVEEWKPADRMTDYVGIKVKNLTAEIKSSKSMLDKLKKYGKWTEKIGPLKENNPLRAELLKDTTLVVEFVDPTDQFMRRYVQIRNGKNGTLMFISAPATSGITYMIYK